MRAALGLAMASAASAQCYLEDASDDCAVCWKTTSAGVVTMGACPDAIDSEWVVPLPEVMTEYVTYGTCLWGRLRLFFGVLALSLENPRRTLSSFLRRHVLGYHR